MSKLIDQTKTKMHDKAYMGQYSENNQSFNNIQVPPE